MAKVRTAPMQFKLKQEIYDLPVKANSLEIVDDSLIDCESVKGFEKEYKCCSASIPVKKSLHGYNFENSDSLVSSSESSSDLDSSPPEEYHQSGNICGNYSAIKSDLKRQEIKREGSFENLSLNEFQFGKESKNISKNSRLLFRTDDTMVNSSQIEKLPDVKNSVLLKQSSNFREEIDDDLKCLLIENNQQNNNFLSSNVKDSECEDLNDFLDSILTCGSLPFKKDDCLSDMLSSYDDCSENNDFKKDIFAESSFVDEQCNLPGIIKNSPEVATFSDLLDDISLNDENDKKSCSLFSSSLSDIDLFLNSVDLIDSNELSAFNSETKLIDIKSSGKTVPNEENISLAALAEQHLQSNALGNARHTAEKSNDDFSSLIEESKSSNTNWFSPLLSKTLCSSEKNENMFDLQANTNQGDSLEKSVNFKSENVTLQAIKDNSGDSLDIDLTSCLKSLRPATPLNDSPANENNNENFNFDSDNHRESPFRYSPSPIQKADDSPSKIKNINASQSLFAKALSCKPKKNLPAMLKVIKLQSDVCRHFFSPSKVPDDIKPVRENSIESNQSVIGSVGRRIFGQIPQCEVL